MSAESAPPYGFDVWVERLMAGHAPEWSELWDEGGERDARWPLRYATRLFSDPAPVVERFGAEHAGRAIADLPIRWQLCDLLADAGVPREEREACIRSMVTLFARVYADPAAGDEGFMWWDSIVTYPGPDEVEREASFAALSEILFMESEACQAAALHGLGHLDHPERAALIDRWLHTHPNACPSLREYAGNAAAGEVL